MGFQEVILKGDSLVVDHDIHASASDRSAHRQIVADIRVVLNSRQSWMIGHTKRDGNQAAHGLAKDALGNQMDRIWLDDIPNCISATVDLELSALSI